MGLYDLAVTLSMSHPNLKTAINVVGFIVAPLLFIRFLWGLSTSQHKGLPRPPGPKGLPVLGNLLQMPRTHLWEKALEWRKDHGVSGCISAQGTHFTY